MGSIWRSQKMNTPDVVKFNEISEHTSGEGITFEDQIQGPDLNTHESLMVASKIVGLCDDPRLVTMLADDPTGTFTDLSGKGHDGTPAGLGAQSYKGSGYTVEFDDDTPSVINYGSHADFRFGDGSNDSSFTIGCLIEVLDTNTFKAVLAKMHHSGSGLEWCVLLRHTRNMSLVLCDDSVAKYPSVYSSALTAGAWYWVVMTYNGTGAGSAAASRMNMYVNGSVDNGAVNNAPLYVAMEDTGANVLLGSRESGTGYHYGYTGGLGAVFLDASEWSAEKVYQSYIMMKGLYNL